MQNGSKLMLKVGQKRGVRVGIFYREIPLGGVNMFLLSGLRPTTGVYISIFTVDLAGNKRLIELGYGMDITTFNLLFKLQIHKQINQLLPDFYSSYLMEFTGARESREERSLLEGYVQTAYKNSPGGSRAVNAHIETCRPWLHEEPVGHDRVFGESHR